MSKSIILDLFLHFIIFFLFIGKISSHSNLKEDGILNLSVVNFSTVLKEYENIFILFVKMLTQEHVYKYEQILNEMKKANYVIKSDNKFNLQFAV